MDQIAIALARGHPHRHLALGNLKVDHIVALEHTEVDRLAELVAETLEMGSRKSSE